jgi:hypothetical protein
LLQSHGVDAQPSHPVVVVHMNGSENKTPPKLSPVSATSTTVAAAALATETPFTDLHFWRPSLHVELEEL